MEGPWAPSLGDKVGGAAPSCLQPWLPALLLSLWGPGNSIHMANSFTLSSSKGCFVKACLMLKDASGSLSPLSKAGLHTPGVPRDQTKLTGIERRKQGFPEPEKGSQVPGLFHPAWSTLSLGGCGTLPHGCSHPPTGLEGEGGDQAPPNLPSLLRTPRMTRACICGAGNGGG